MPNQKVYAPIPIHYSNVALVLERTPEQEARDEFARSSEASSSSSSSSSSQLPEVVATRLRATNIHYDTRRRRWSWKRLAESIAEIDPVTGHKHSVEWPKQERLSSMKPTKKYLRKSLVCFVAISSQSRHLINITLCSHQSRTFRYTLRRSYQSYICASNRPNSRAAKRTQDPRPGICQCSWSCQAKRKVACAQACRKRRFSTVVFALSQLRRNAYSHLMISLRHSDSAQQSRPLLLFKSAQRLC